MILLSVSLCLYFFVAKETDGLMLQAIQNGDRDVAIFCDHLSTLERTSSAAYDADAISRQSLIQYTFFTYAHLLAQAHGGRLEILSEAGRGTTISMIWPTRAREKSP